MANEIKPEHMEAARKIASLDLFWAMEGVVEKIAQIIADHCHVASEPNVQPKPCQVPDCERNGTVHEGYHFDNRGVYIPRPVASDSLEQPWDNASDSLEQPDSRP